MQATLLKILGVWTSICFVSSLHAQNFRINSEMGSQRVCINQQWYGIDSNFQEIPTLSGDFDRVQNSERPLPIYCNFEPDSSYTLSLACCGSMDIYPSWKLQSDSLKHWDYEEDFDKIQSLLLDRPQFTLRLENPNPADTIYGWNADYACFTKFNRLNENGWFLGSPEKCFYWTNIACIQFLKSDLDFSSQWNAEEHCYEDFPGEPDQMELLETILVRIFDDASYIISYDVLKGTATIHKE